MKIKLRLWVKLIIFIIILFALLFLYCRYIDTKGIKVKEYPIVDKNIPENFYGFKIIHISDIHYKSTTDLNDLKKIINKINMLKPDIVIFSGDLFDKDIKYSKQDFDDITKILKSINYNIGKYAIKGEHDLKIKEWESIISNSDFIDLNDKSEFIYSNGINPILLIGISSNSKNNHIKDTLNNIYNSVKDEYKYSILLLHEPDFINEIEYNKFNLILAGHSHNGQIVLPYIGGIIKDEYYKIFYKEYYSFQNTKMFISSGIGTSKYKLRFLNKPSINFYRLRNK